MTRRSFVAGAPVLLLQKRTAAPKLNVLLILSDDLTSTALGCYGHPLVKSPNIDRLASRGTRFDRAYCQFPLCGPSRASFLTGLRPDTTRILRNEVAVRDTMRDAITLPQLFRNSGWTSARFGKMYHMNVPGSVGTNLWDDPPSWDVAVSPPGAENKTPGEGRNITPKHAAGNAMHWISFRREAAPQADAGAVRQTIEYVTKQKSSGGGQPWFLGLGLLRPHVPLVAPDRFFDLYPASAIQPVMNPANDRDDIPKASELTLTGRGDDMGMSEADKREALRGYFASVSYMDSLVGEAIAHLERSGELSRTVVVFASDHGWHLGEHYRWQKRSLFEESARVPLIVSAPSRPAGRVTRRLVEMVDLYPTLVELCGLKAPANLEGQSFVPLLDNPDRAWKRAAFTQVTGPENIEGRSVRTERYRYIRWTGPYPDEELYDLKTDPREFANLARRADAANLLNQMRKTLDAGWRAARAG